MKKCILDKNGLELHINNLKKAEKVFRAINHKLRQDLIYFIHSRGATPVFEIYRHLNLEQSATSQHLGILRKEGILIAERDAKRVLYSVNYERIKEINKATSGIMV